MALVFPCLVFADGSTGSLHLQPRSFEIQALWDAGKKSKAEKLIDAWKKEEKDSPWPWVQEAALSVQEKKYKRALSLTKAALEKAPQCAEAYYWRGRSYEAMKQYLDAANEYRAALMGESQLSEAQEGLDRVSAQLGS